MVSDQRQIGGVFLIGCVRYERPTGRGLSDQWTNELNLGLWGVSQANSYGLLRLSVRANARDIHMFGSQSLYTCICERLNCKSIVDQHGSLIMSVVALTLVM